MSSAEEGLLRPSAHYNTYTTLMKISPTAHRVKEYKEMSDLVPIRIGIVYREKHSYA